MTSNLEKRYKDFEDLPLLLHAEDICRLLGVSKPYAYVILHSDNLKTITIGSRILVRKEVFIDWLASCECNENGELI